MKSDANLMLRLVRITLMIPKLPKKAAIKPPIVNIASSPCASARIGVTRKNESMDSIGVFISPVDLTINLGTREMFSPDPPMT
jgi:hypothetical protein